MQFWLLRLGILKDRESESALRTDPGAKPATCAAPGDRRHVETPAPFGAGGTNESVLRTDLGAETAGGAGFGKGRNLETKSIASGKMSDPSKEKVGPEHTVPMCLCIVTFRAGSRGIR